MAERRKRTAKGQKFPFVMAGRVSASAHEAARSFLAAHPEMTKSDLLEQSILSFAGEGGQWDRVFTRFDLQKKLNWRILEAVEKQTEILLHFVRTFYYHVDGKPTEEQKGRADRFYHGFLASLNKLLETQFYGHRLYRRDFDSVVQEEMEAAEGRQDRAEGNGDGLRAVPFEKPEKSGSGPSRLKPNRKREQGGPLASHEANGYQGETE